MIDSLRHDLATWTRATIAAAIGERALRALDRDIAVPASLACAGGGRIHQLTRLFWLGEGLSRAELKVALPDAGARLAADADLLIHDGGLWRSRWQIVPVDVPAHLRPASPGAPADADPSETVWIASSRGSLHGARHGKDFVMGVGGATRTLAALAAFTPGQFVLDLGTGSGILAILAARCGARVVATDISTPALDMARFNAEFNGVADSIDFRRGSLFEPAPERFDVVVTNPPFVITPAAAREGVGKLDYRDAGWEGDQLSARVIGALADHLNADGRAWMLTNWEVTDAADPYTPVRGWAGNLDVHLVMRELLPVTSYIEMWLRDGGLTPAHPDYARSYRAWLEDFDARNVTHVGMGYLAAGRGAGRVLAQELRGIAPPNLHEYMERIWAGLRQEDLARLAPVATDVVEHRFYRPGEEEPWIIKFTQTAGFGEEVLADTALAGLMSVADGELTTAQIVCALAEILSVAPDKLMEKVIPKVAQLKQLGMLTFVEPVGR